MKEEKLKKLELQNKTKIETTIKDGLYIVVGNIPITKSDIVNEVKMILILSNKAYTPDKRDELQKIAIKSIIKRSIKKIEIDKNELQYNPEDFKSEINNLAKRINMDVTTFKKTSQANNLDFALIEDSVKTDLLWNSLIFNLYVDQISVNLKEIDEQLKSNQNKKKFSEYLISEIIIKSVEKSKLESKIEEIKQKIATDGFENVALKISIAQSAVKGGDLGWVNENTISEKYKQIIANTSVGSLSKPILLNEGIVLFKVRDKRKVKSELDLEKLKQRLVNNEKTKILNMYSMQHYDALRRSISIKFINE